MRKKQQNHINEVYHNYISYIVRKKWVNAVNNCTVK